MRALRVLGLSEVAAAPKDGSATRDQSSVKNLICEDPATGEQFSVPCDDRLRAGARGDLSRFGQLEIEMESQLRPREIQARIRAGASIEQVAALAGTTASRVDRFAYPVLLERASVAEKARKARPAIDGITAAISVTETVAATLAARGHDGDVAWDAYKDDEGWVLTLTWSVGRSENRAHWLFHPGPDGGTLSARDEAAAEIVDPALRILRPLRPVRADAVSAVLMDPTARAADSVRTADSIRAADSVRGGHPAGSKLSTAAKPGARGSRFGADNAQPEQTRTERIVEDTVTDERTGTNPLITRREEVRTGTEPVRSGLISPPSPSAPGPARPVTPARPTAPTKPATAARPTAPAVGPAQPTASAASKPARKGARPAMPSWEDVLLGTRSNGH